MKLDFEKHNTVKEIDNEVPEGEADIEVIKKPESTLQVKNENSAELNQFMMFERRLDDLMKFAVIECESVDISGKFKRLKVGPIINDYIN